MDKLTVWRVSEHLRNLEKSLYDGLLDIDMLSRLLEKYDDDQSDIPNFDGIRSNLFEMWKRINEFNYVILKERLSKEWS